MTFVADGTGTVGTYRNIETYIIALGSGVNTVTTGAGDDTINSASTSDTIDGGAGDDTYTLDLRSGVSTPQSASYTTASASGTTTGGAFTHVEIFIYFGGREVDTFVLNGRSDTAGGTTAIGSGTDGFSIDNFASGGTTLYLSGVENLSLLLGNRNDTVVVSADALAKGATLSLDGGGGTDSLQFNLLALTGARLILNADGTITSNFASFTSFEQFNVSTGAGANTVVAGVEDDVLTGSNTAKTAGADTFFGGAGVDTLRGYLGDDVLDGGSGTDTIDGGAGNDTASYVDATSAVTVTIKTGQQNTFGAGLDTLTGIENLTGSDFADTLTGDATANVIDGGAGNDKLDGAAGVDTASYARATAGVSVKLSLTAAQDTGGAGVDTLLNFENLTGSSFDDVLAGTAGGNVLAGGGGFDTASYAGAAAAVTVSLAAQGAVQNTGGGGADTLTGFSALIGSAFADTLTGDARANTIEGGAGDDLLAGGAETDTASYALATAGVTVSLAAQGAAQATGGAGSDTLSGFENVAGSAFADMLSGDANANTLAGAGGDDVLAGGGGTDRLFGGAGTDTVVLSGVFADYDVVDNGDGSYTVTDLRAGSPDGVLTLSGIEQVRLASGTFATGDVVNAAPMGVDDRTDQLVEAGRDGAGIDTASGNVLTNDTDANLLVPGLGETLTVVQVRSDAFPVQQIVTGDTVVDGVYGTLTIRADGSYSYALDNSAQAVDQLAPGQVVEDHFTYLLADLHGAEAFATLVFTVTGADDTVAGADSLQVTRGRASSLDAAILLGNDTGALGETLAITGVSNAVGATVALVDGKLVVTATAATGGFDYTVATSGGGSATGHVDLTSIATPTRITAVAPAGVTAVDYVGGEKVDTLTGSDGDDRLVGNGGKDVLDGGAGADRMEGGASADTYTVDDVGDLIVETSATGIDVVLVGLSNYVLGDNVELLTFTGSGDFVGVGNAVRNTITGGAGNDQLSGGDSVDALIGGAGDDLLDGGTAGDIASYAGASAGVTVDLRIAGQQDTLGGGRDTLISIESLTGSSFADVLNGSDGANTLTGGGNRDTLYGNAGTDRLIGGVASDTVYGGTGADAFIFTSLNDISSGDRIADFSHGQGDTIDLSLVDADVALDGVQNFTFVGTAAFTGSAGTGYELRYQPGAAGSGDLIVQGDINHDGTADFSFIVHAPSLQASDFVLAAV